MKLFDKDKPYMKFKRILQYCKLMKYDIDEILNMSENELRLWYKHVLDIIDDETKFMIKTGISIDNDGTKHKTVSIIETRFSKKGAD